MYRKTIKKQMRKIFFLLFTAITLTQIPLAAQVQPTPDDSLSIDTLREVIVNGDTLLRINEAIRNSLKQQGINKISTKNVSDIIGAKMTDKMLHPFAIAERKRERKHARDRKALEEYERLCRQKTFEDLLMEAIRQQAIEDEKKQPATSNKK